MTAAEFARLSSSRQLMLLAIRVARRFDVAVSAARTCAGARCDGRTACALQAVACRSFVGIARPSAALPVRRFQVDPRALVADHSTHAAVARGGFSGGRVRCQSKAKLSKGSDAKPPARDVARVAGLPAGSPP
jgi:hypothetical protein